MVVSESVGVLELALIIPLIAIIIFPIQNIDEYIYETQEIWWSGIASSPDESGRSRVVSLIAFAN